jgi:hypothetical protein
MQRLVAEAIRTRVAQTASLTQSVVEGFFGLRLYHNSRGPETGHHRELSRGTVKPM